MKLLQRAADNRMATALKIAGNDFTIWIEHQGREYEVKCIGGDFKDGAKPLDKSFVHVEMRDVVALVDPQLFPPGYVVKDRARFHASLRGTRETARAFQVESSREHSATRYIEISGVRGK